MDFENEFIKIVEILITKGVAASAIETACNMPKTKISKIKRGDAVPKKIEYQRLLNFAKSFEGIVADESTINDEVESEFKDKDKIIALLLNRIEIEKDIKKLEKFVNDFLGKKDGGEGNGIEKELKTLKEINKQIKEIKNKF